MKDDDIRAHAEQIAQAAHNNAVWCDTICRAHGQPGVFRDSIWINQHTVPRFYPNAVTLVAPPLLRAGEGAGGEGQRASINDLVALRSAGSCSVKDSFCALDLAPLGFQLLFEAEWLWRPAALPPPDSDIAGIRWAKVSSADELAAWETAWNGVPADELASPARIFLPTLLADEQIAFIAAYRDQRIVAGAIANRTRAVVGVSNVYAPADDTAHYWAGCVASAIAAFPGMPLVGYERGDELAVACALGFERLGPLRVWLKPSASENSR